MRILVLTKRQYTNQDLLDNSYGRLRELPLALASLGHEVVGICLSYYSKEERTHFDRKGNGCVIWNAINFKSLLPWKGNKYWRLVDGLEKEFHPDLVWACSDAFHVILGAHVAKRLKIPLVADLYDNFESFGLTKIPGMTPAFRRALRYATGLSCISHPLARYVQKTSASSALIAVIENGVPDGLFRPLDKKKSRVCLKLPVDGQIIGVAGAISKSRGIGTLFQAFAVLAQEIPNLHLALAGCLDNGLAIPQHPRVHYLGMLPPTDVPRFLSALDVAVIANKNSEFGKYCFPQKFYESVACGIPVVAAKVGVLKDLLQNSPEYLFIPEDAESLAMVLRLQITRLDTLSLAVPTWDMLARKLELFFESCLSRQK